MCDPEHARAALLRDGLPALMPFPKALERAALGQHHQRCTGRRTSQKERDRLQTVDFRSLELHPISTLHRYRVGSLPV